VSVRRALKEVGEEEGGVRVEQGVVVPRSSFILFNITKDGMR
jgi:hypothetical protein